MKTKKIIVISGPSGSGKGTIFELLLKKHSDQLTKSISATTRIPRPGEQNGVDYFFLSPDEFEQKVRNGEFIEQFTVHGNRYGTLTAQVKSKLKPGKDLVLVIDVQGARAVKKHLPASILIFIKPPNLAELESRLKSRKTDTQGDIRRRLNDAKQEIAIGKTEFDHMVLNPTGHPEQAVAEIEKLLNL